MKKLKYYFIVGIPLAVVLFIIGVATDTLNLAVLALIVFGFSIFYPPIRTAQEKRNTWKIPEMSEREKLIEKYRSESIAYCPRCLSTSLTANKKGFGIGKAVVGGALVGPLGLVAGNIGRSNVTVTCLNCGNRFKPGRR
jgi:hypothetical protein